MDQDEEGDLSLQRASSSAIAGIKKRIDHLVTCSSQLSANAKKSRNVARIVALMNMFQENPQLLDPHLKEIVPPLVSCFLLYIQTSAFQQNKALNSTRIGQVSEIICVLCKVRGKKVISHFLDNEPRYIVPMCNALKVVTEHEPSSIMHDGASTGDLTVDTLVASHSSVDSHYVILLWLSHLILTPFDLASVAADSDRTPMVPSLEVPSGLPPVAGWALRAGIDSLDSPTNRQSVAAALLVRLSLRPDMHRFNMLDSLLTWALSRLKAEKKAAAATIHQAVGLLTLLNGIIASGAMDEVAPHLQLVYATVTHVFSNTSDHYRLLQDSAAAKRQSVKIKRNIVVHLLQARDSQQDAIHEVVQAMLNTASALEDVVDYLLTLLADRDTQVRIAASKALSLIATKLDAPMAEEVVEAILGSLQEDVLDDTHGKTLTTVNPVRWHGLVLTLSHMLFRRTPAPGQLAEVLDALYLALRFEQKSSSGSSIGGNVRDAANFGMWSLARRYSTAELEQTAIANPTISTLQTTANNLVCAACLDPVGNVRRGSSAALQELVGRHPDTIVNGISLVQVIDYQAVGKRSRALQRVAIDAASLDITYKDALLCQLYDWRGVSASDLASRQHAAWAVGELAQSSTFGAERNRISEDVASLQLTTARGVETRQGLLFCLSRLILCNSDHEFWKKAGSGTPSKLDHGMYGTWFFLDRCAELSLKGLTPRTKNFSTVATGILHLASSVATIQTGGGTSRLNQTLSGHAQSVGPSTVAMDYIYECLESVDELSPDSFDFAKALDPESRQAYMNKLTNRIRSVARTTRIPGVVRALGHMYGCFDDSKEAYRVNPGLHADAMGSQASIVQTLTRLAAPSEEIEGRELALRSIGNIIIAAGHGSRRKCRFPRLAPDVARLIMSTLGNALDDYTTNERGDIGSLVRLEAMKAYSHFGLTDGEAGNLEYKDTLDLSTRCQRSVLRLSLERLDRVRLQAFITMSTTFRPQWLPAHIGSIDVAPSLLDVSCYEHFQALARFLSLAPTDILTTQDVKNIGKSIIQGFVVSAGSGSSALQSTARAALTDVLGALHSFSPGEYRKDSSPDGREYRDSESNNPTNMTILDVGETLLQLLSKNLNNDRLLIPLLETIACLLDARILQRLSTGMMQPDTISILRQPTYAWRTLLSLVQKAHYKTSSIPKLLAAISVYYGLCDIPKIKVQVLTKMVSMLSHPFAKVRSTIAEALYLVTEEDELVGTVWTRDVAENRGAAREVRSRILGICDEDMFRKTS